MTFKQHIIRILIIIGFCNYDYERGLRWPFHAPPFHRSEGIRGAIARARMHGPFYIFKNQHGVIKWLPGRILPRRWGFGIFGFEFGDRG